MYSVEISGVPDESMFTGRPDAICTNAIIKRKGTEGGCRRMILAAGRRVPKFRLIAPLTASVHLYSKDAFRSNIPTVSIPTGISICSLPDIIGSVDFSKTNCILLLDGRINSRLEKSHYAFSNLLFRHWLRDISSIFRKVLRQILTILNNACLSNNNDSPKGCFD